MSLVRLLLSTLTIRTLCWVTVLLSELMELPLISQLLNKTAKVIPLKYAGLSHWYSQNLSVKHPYGQCQNPCRGPQSQPVWPLLISQLLFPSLLVTIRPLLSFVNQGALALQDIGNVSFSCLECFSPKINTVNSFPYSLLTGHLSHRHCLIYPLIWQTNFSLLSPLSILFTQFSPQHH